LADKHRSVEKHAEDGEKNLRQRILNCKIQHVVRRWVRGVMISVMIVVRVPIVMRD